MTCSSQFSGCLRGNHRVQVTPKLSLADLRAVTSGTMLALIVPGYCTVHECHRLCDRLLNFHRWTTYEAGTGAEQIGTLGQSLFGCLGQELCSGYFDSAVDTLRELSDHLRPFANPIDRVIRELDIEWPSGASLWHLGGRVCFAGLVRMFREGGEALPHDDRADIDFPSIETSKSLDQLLINIYPNKTEAGGHLEIWDRRIADRSEYDRLRFEQSYGLRRTELGQPTVVIDPPIGALVIGSARRIHAVTRCEGNGMRLSISAFAQYSGEHCPLFVHS